MKVFLDASLGKVEGRKSKIGYMIGLRDGKGERCSSAWKLKIRKKGACFTIEAEMIGLREGFEMAVFL